LGFFALYGNGRISVYIVLQKVNLQVNASDYHISSTILEYY